MLLLVDIGNSSVKWLITPADTFKPLQRGILSFDKLHFLEKFKDIPHKFVASVKPSLNPKIKKILINPYFVEMNDCKTLIDVNYKTPQTLGIDRVLNAIGGFTYANSFIVVSFGTATVIDVVVNRTFLGGAIFLGLEKEAECLAQKAELLAEVFPKTKPSLIGKSTSECLSSGVFYNQFFTTIGYLEGIKKHFEVEKVLCTGGYSEIFGPHIRSCVVDRDLLFKGLFEIFKLKKMLRKT